MIPKQDKDPLKAKNYLLISHTNCLAKICEIVMKNIDMVHCENQNISDEIQRGYRKYRCTTDIFIKITQHVSGVF